MTGRGPQGIHAATVALATLAALRPDGPDEMGRELARGPAAVSATLTGLEPALTRLRAELAAARRVVLIGTGASLAMARTVAPLWGGGGGDVAVRESSAVVFGADGPDLSGADVAVAVSKSGRSPETVAAARRASDGAARVIAVTADAESSLALAADEVVLTPIGEESGAATKSELAALAALLALAGALEPAVAGGVRERLEAIVADWSWAAEIGPSLAAAGHVWILGFGAAQGLAAAGGLMWHEKVHRPAVASTPSEFRHGPIESATARDAVILVERPGAGNAERAYLGRMGSELGALAATLVRIAAPVEGDAEHLLGSLLRLQQLARATAHAAGTYRDGFAILRQIITAANL